MRRWDRWTGRFGTMARRGFGGFARWAARRLAVPTPTLALMVRYAGRRRR